MYTALYTYTNDQGALFNERIVATTDNADNRFKFLSGKLTYEIDRAGSFEFSVMSTNPEISLFEPMSIKIRVVKDGATVWMGRVLTIKQDMTGVVNVFCEGCLAYLSDYPMDLGAMPVSFYDITDGGTIGVEKTSDLSSSNVTVIPSAPGEWGAVGKIATPPEAELPQEIKIDENYPHPTEFVTDPSQPRIIGKCSNPYSIVYCAISNNNKNRESDCLKFDMAIFREAYTGRFNLDIVGTSYTDNFDSIYDYLVSKLVDTYGWHFIVMFNDSLPIKPLLYVFNTSPYSTKGCRKGNQEITLNKNLVDFNLEYDGSGYFTHIIPVGKDGLLLGYQPLLSERALPIGDSAHEGREKKVKIVRFPDAESKERLQALANEWIEDYKINNTDIGYPFIETYDIKAVDLNWESSNMDDMIMAGYEYTVNIPYRYNDPNGTADNSIQALCYKSEIDILDPLNSTYAFNFKYMEYIRNKTTVDDRLIVVSESSDAYFEIVDVGVGD